MSLLADTNTTATLVGAVIGFVIWIGIIFWTVSIARKKGRSGGLWGVLAFFFSLIPLIIVAILPSKKSSSVAARV
jgi:predicted PurR-regulated permease PerM